jgi:putrescine aminotransferase
MVRAIRDTIVMSPPLVISHAEIDQLVGTIRGALDEAASALRALKAAA